MSDFLWKCVTCGGNFDPLQENGEFNFKCPDCNSIITIPVRERNEKKEF